VAILAKLNWRNCQGSIYWPFSKKDDAEETAQQLDIKQESYLFGKFKTFNKNVADKETVKRGHRHSAYKLLVEGTVCDSARKLLLKNL